MLIWNILLGGYQNSFMMICELFFSFSLNNSQCKIMIKIIKRNNKLGWWETEPFNIWKWPKNKIKKKPENDQNINYPHPVQHTHTHTQPKEEKENPSFLCYIFRLKCKMLTDCLNVRLNGLVVDKHQWIAQPSTVIPAELLQALRSKPGGGRVHVHEMIHTICKRIEANSIDTAPILWPCTQILCRQLTPNLASPELLV